jgi:hypothetical protein
MKKFILPIGLLLILAISCENEKPAEYTRLGDGTPYSNSPEMLNGKVKSVIEKNYWAIVNGDSIEKGSPLTQADRDSLGGWTDDFEAVFDENGLILKSSLLDENGSSVWKNESIIENGLVVKRNIFRKDTLSSYDQYTYDENKFLKTGSRFRAVVDTLMFSVDAKTNELGTPIEFQIFNSKGDSTWRNVYNYDADNKFLSFERFDKEGKRVFAYEQKYNDKNKVSELTVKDQDDKIIDVNYITYEYDLNGNWTKAVVKNLKEKVVIEERVYTYFE